MPRYTPTSQFNYILPEELIAIEPVARRSASRLMVVWRQGGIIEHRHFFELPEILSRTSDLLVLNDTRVRPSVMRAMNQPVEFTLLEETSPRHWLALALPGKKAQVGCRFEFEPVDATDNPFGSHGIVEAEVLKTLPSGERVLRFFRDFPLHDYARLQLPPYIKKRRKVLHQDADDLLADDQVKYQTIFSEKEKEGSVAAPTAGLHFTPELLNQFHHQSLTLHIGMGTFRPVKSKWVQQHEMHSESYEVPATLEPAVHGAQRVVAVGTTVTRVLESIPNLAPRRGRTNIFIYPPYTFKRVDVLLTNFHLPQSTLLMLVCAFGGTELILRAYSEAIAQRYRFYSYGDAMLIL